MSAASAATAVPAPPAWLTWGLRLVALGLGALHTMIAIRSQSMNEDGIQYLDLGDAWWQGQWDAMINTTWSPLYAWILGAVVNLSRPSVWWEFPVVQVTNFLFFVAALACFELFWRQLTRVYFADRAGDGEVVRIPAALWWALGYSLFIYVTLNLVQLWAVTPDMLVTALVFLAAVQLLRLEREDAGTGAALVLGLVLGLAYLAKAAMFPLGVVCLVLASMLGWRTAGRAARLAAMSIALLAVALPWAAAISSSVGHATFSDVGRFAYLKHVNRMPWPGWEAAAERVGGTALHPPREIYADPLVREFASPVGGTYPLGYDPAWWTRGLEPKVEAGAQLAALAGNLMYYFDLFVRMQGGFAMTLIILLAMSHRSWRDWRRLDGPTALLLWSLCAFGLYALVFAEARYLAPFVLLLWAGLLVRVRLPGGPGQARLAITGGVLLTLFAWMNIAALNLEGLAGVVGFTPSHEMAAGAARGRSLADGHALSHPEIAESLQQIGLRPGDRIAFVGYSYSAYWARLARLKIVAEVPPEHVESFWQTDDAQLTRLLAALREAGAIAIVAEPVHPMVAGGPWLSVGSGGLVVRWLDADRIAGIQRAAD